ncbi:hypothetical protein ACW4TU_18640 [Streptomyces sp. QTS52]
MTARHHQGRPLRRALVALGAGLTAAALLLTAGSHQPDTCRPAACTTR